jgi:hypothetical protein
MNTKPQLWEECDYDFMFHELPHLTRISIDYLGIIGPGERFPPEVHRSLQQLGLRKFVLQRGDKEYLVNTEGYDYCRYVHRIK